MNEDLETRISYLRSISFLRHVSDDALSALAQRMTLRSYPEGALLFDVSTPGDALYIVHTGEVEILTEDDLPLAVVRPGSVVGEMGFLTGGERRVKARAIRPVSALVLSRADYDALSVVYPELKRAIDHALAQRAGRTALRPTPERLQSLDAFQGLDPQALSEIVQHLDALVYPAGATIYDVGEQADYLYFVIEGEVQVTEREEDGERSYRVRPGQFFGEQEILAEDSRRSTAVALQRTVCWSLGANDVLDLIARYPRFALNLVRLASKRVYTQEVTPPPPPEEPVYTPPTQTAPTVVRTVPPPENKGREGGAWYRNLDMGVRIRLLALAVLLVWLVGVAVPYMVRDTMQRNRMYANIDHSRLETTVIGNSPAGVPLAPGFELQYPTPTATPVPTATPTP